MMEIEKTLKEMGCTRLLNMAQYQKWHLGHVLVYLKFPDGSFVVTRNRVVSDNYPEFTGALSDTESLEKAILKAFFNN